VQAYEGRSTAWGISFESLFEFLRTRTIGRRPGEARASTACGTAWGISFESLFEFLRTRTN
jgi:uncharacterized membrane protein